jgi:hypothetical protein
MDLNSTTKQLQDQTSTTSKKKNYLLMLEPEMHAVHSYSLLLAVIKQQVPSLSEREILPESADTVGELLDTYIRVQLYFLST